MFLLFCPTKLTLCCDCRTFANSYQQNDYRAMGRLTHAPPNSSLIHNEKGRPKAAPLVPMRVRSGGALPTYRLLQAREQAGQQVARS